MSLIVALGSNIGDRKSHLKAAIEKITSEFSLIAKSRIYESEPVDYLDQDFFYNQVIELETPKAQSIYQTWKALQRIEESFGHKKLIFKGPRIIDIDLVFYNLEIYSAPDLCVPHLSWKERSFVVRPLLELPYSEVIKQKFEIPESFNSKAVPLNI